MTAPSKVSEMPRAAISAARVHKPRKFPVSDGAPVEAVYIVYRYGSQTFRCVPGRFVSGNVPCSYIHS